MTALPGFFSSFIAGLLSFLSPCVLPLIPVYLSFISGETVDISAQNAEGKRFRLFRRTLYFVLGFTIVFAVFAAVLYAGMNLAGAALAGKIKKIAGVLIIILGVNMIFDFIPLLRSEVRGQANKVESKAAGPLRSILFGMLFAAGWTPCIGPILGAILLYAGQAETSAHAIASLVLYSLGLGIPFILTGLFIDQVTPLLNFLKKRGTVVKIISGILIIGFGVAMIFGWLS